MLLVSLAVGITVDRQFAIPLLWALSLCISLAIATLILVRVQRPAGSVLPTLLLIISGAGLGAAWHHVFWRVFPATDIGLFAPEQAAPARLRGYLVHQPDVIPSRPPSAISPQGRPTKSQFLLDVTQLDDQSNWISVSGRIVVTVAGDEVDGSAGQEIELSGQLSRPQLPSSPLDFDLREFYRSRRIHALLFVPDPGCVRLTGNTNARYFGNRFFDQARRICRNRLKAHVPQRSFPLISAMLLGDRFLVSREQRDLFLITGTMHLLAISGLHVGILCSGFWLLIRTGLIERRTGYLATIFFVVFYCLMTGSRPPVMRATILVVLYCLARLSGRNPISLNSLAVAGLLVIGLNPAALFQPGAQLSFIAVATLILIAAYRRDRSRPDSLDLFLRRKRSRFQRIRDGIVDYLGLLALCSMGIWLVTFPLVASEFHVISPVGIGANVILMVPITLALNAGFLTLLLGLIGYGGWAGQATDYLIQSVLQTVKIMGDLPGSHFWTPGFGAVWLALFYIPFFVLVLWEHRRPPVRVLLLLFAFWLGLFHGVKWISQLQDNDEMSVTFIDVGHGTSVLIEFPNGRTLLYDAGSLRAPQTAVERISTTLWERRISRIDTLVISHADLDHYNAVPGLLQRFAINRILVSPQMLAKPDGSLPKQFLAEIKANAIRIESVNSPQELTLDPGCPTAILHPSSEFQGVSDNANSIVLLIKYRHQSLLLPGDLEHDGLSRVVSGPEKEISVMMAPHHGSLTADHLAIAEWCHPDHVVISGSGPRVSPQVLEKYHQTDAQVWTTADSGRIRFLFTPSGIQVRTTHKTAVH